MTRSVPTEPAGHASGNGESARSLPTRGRIDHGGGTPELDLRGNGKGVFRGREFERP